MDPVSAIDFTNAKGEIRYQPAHPDGRRLTDYGWVRASDDLERDFYTPRLYRTRRRAYRQVSKLIERENRYHHERFKEVK